MELTKEQLDIITSQVIEIHEKQLESEEKKKLDKRLRNTKLLLRNYRAFKEYAKNIQEDAIDDIGAIDVEELLVFGQDVVKSIRQSSERTVLMVRHIDHGLATLKYILSMEKHPGTRRQYNILHARFVEGKKIEEIAEENEIDTRSVYKAIDAAVERLSIILFGVYGIRIK